MTDPGPRRSTIRVRYGAAAVQGITGGNMMTTEITSKRRRAKPQGPTSKRPVKVSQPTAMTPFIPNTPVQTHDEFNMIANDMYKRFGAVYTNLKALVTTPAENNYLVSQLHDLRDAVRELLNQARGK